jgi:hypothetical protein
MVMFQSIFKMKRFTKFLNEFSKPHTNNLIERDFSTYRPDSYFLLLAHPESKTTSRFCS